MANRTVGRTFTTPDGKEYRPSMFLTLTLPSYGSIRHRHRRPGRPGAYDYRRAALDALHFPKLVDRFWQNLRRCAGYRVQYFAALEPQARLAPHLHAAIRGVIPRAVLKKVIEATYVQTLVAVLRPAGLRASAAGVDRRRLLRPRHRSHAAHLGRSAGPAAKPTRTPRPAHVMRFGAQYDLAGIIAPSPDADRAVRYLAKYLTKAVADPLGDRDSTPGREAHIDRLHAELRWLPCSPRCANWLRYGIQPDQPGPGLVPGRCTSKAHDREHLGCGGRRVLVSRDWSGKTLAKHKADRATVVRASAGRGRDAHPRRGTHGRRRAVPGRAAPVRVDRRQARPDHLHPDAAPRRGRTATLARPVRPGQDRGWGCGQPFGNWRRPA